ncbi:hypothetical protein GJAV_G00119580 [Gymnothorax javanicus]|nr:hypothetical protein GJAV_G00119580 [Gymnothorax javanicus]
MLRVMAQEKGVWSHAMLQGIFSEERPETEKVHEFLALEGPALLEMRIKHLIKENQLEKAAQLAKACSEYPEFEGKGHFKQTYLVCLCATVAQEPLMQEISSVDCRDALEMICNLESDGDEKGALRLCSAFLTRQLLQGDMYCAWELTLFWSKLLKRLEPSVQAFLDRCRQMSLLSKTVCHILFLIKVIQSEMENAGLPVCIELCIRALQMESNDSANTKATICKTILCLLPSDLEVKRACQLTEFLLEPTVDSYYAVETLYNEPDQKFEEESLSVPNSLRCELLLVFKTQWPFDPEFWDWKTLKKHCLALMGEEASIVSSIDELNDSENAEDDELIKEPDVYKDQAESFWDTTVELNEMEDERKKKREIKKLREKGFVSARFRNWQAYMQYCVLCDKEFLGHRIVRHAQTHVKDGIYSCPICAETFDLKDVLVPHVASHVKQSCKERLAAMKTSKKLAKSKTAIPDSAADKNVERQEWKPKMKDGPISDIILDHNISGSAGTFPTKNDLSALKVENGEEYTCPVVNCRKGFKYYRNLIAHVKAHRNNDEASRYLEMQSKKVVCQYCRRQFVSVTHLNDHLQVHCGVRPYICIQLNCKASFLSNAELLVHRKEHAVFKAKCMFPNCGKVFHEAYMLYDHEAQHYNTFTCKVPGCHKLFHTKSELDLHQKEHISKPEELVPSEDHTPFLVKNEPLSGSLMEPNNSAHVDSEVLDNRSFHAQHVEQIASSQPGDIPSHLPGHVKVKHSVERMLNSALGQMQESEHHMAFKTEPPDDMKQAIPMPGPDGSRVQSSVNTQLSESIQPELGNPTVPSAQQDPRNTVLHPRVIQGTPQSSCSSVLQSQAQSVFPHDQNHIKKNGNAVRDVGKPECRETVPAKHPGSFLQTHQIANQTQLHMSAKMAAIPPCVAQQSVLQHTLPQSVRLAGTANTISQPPRNTNPVPPRVEKERHKCAFETCTRNYSSYRSVTKHMKAAHPDFYVEWKLAKRNNKVLKPGTVSVSTGVILNSGVQLQDNGRNGGPVSVIQTQNSSGQVQQYSTGGTNPTISDQSFSTHSSTITSQTFNDQMESILNPILLSQLGGSPNQTHSVSEQIGPNLPWTAQPANNPDLSQQAACSSRAMPSHMQGLSSQAFSSHLNTSNNGLRADVQHSDIGGQPALHNQHIQSTDPFLQPHVDNSCGLSEPMTEHLHPSCVTGYTTNLNSGAQSQMDITGRGFGHMESSTQIIASNMEGLPNSLLTSAMENMHHPVLPSFLDSLKDPVLPDQLENSANSLLQSQNQNSSFSNFSTMQADYPSHGNSSLQPSTDSGLPGNMNTSRMNAVNPTVTRTKRNKRAKWPAIIKDGKFICCRCFREFPSPKSLGGHLSKRSHCKAFDETDLTADLPMSFLDLLNSPHVMNAHQQPVASNFNPSTVIKEHSSQPLSSQPVEPRFFPNVTFPQANGSTYTNNGEENGEVLRQVLDNPTIPNIFEPSGISQQSFQNPCSSYSADSLPESTVIQHTGNIPIKTEGVPPKEDFIKPGFGSDDFSDPLLSQILAENNSAVSLNSLPTDHLNQILRAETMMKMREQKGNEETQTGGLSNDGLLAAMASLAQNLMTNPLLQITSDEPQKSPMMPRSPPSDSLKKSEKNVKKKLREQILAGDISRKGNLPPATSADGNATLKNLDFQEMLNSVHSTSSGSQSSELSTVIQTCSDGEKGDDLNTSLATSVPPPQSNGMMLAASNTPVSSSSHPSEASVSGSTVTNEPDSGADLLPSDEDKIIIEIQRAFEKLDLNMETTNVAEEVNNSSVSDSNGNDVISKNVESVVPNSSVVNDLPVAEGFVKPFACENEGCNYRAMTKDALFKHLIKTHNYTDEMIFEIKKNHGKFAPFRCQMCGKTFTRNSNLRAHCQTVHGLSHAEMVRLKIKRQYIKKEKPVEPEVSNHRVGKVKLSQPCVKNVSKLDPPGENESLKQQCMSPDVRLEQLSEASLQNAVFGQEWMKQEYHSFDLEQTSTTLAVPDQSQEDKGLSASQPMQQTQGMAINNFSASGQAPPAVAMTGYCMHSQSTVYAPTVEQSSHGQHVSVPSMPSQCPAVPHYEGFSPAESTPMVQVSAGIPQADQVQAGTLSPDGGKRLKVFKPRITKPKVEKPDVESPKKPNQKRPVAKTTEVDEGFSPYRPYRCVHRGCTAAFTIQQNLILHYRAIHQSVLPKFEDNAEDEVEIERRDQQKKVEEQHAAEGSEVLEVSEFRCQVKDCSSIFQVVTSLLQHYLQLHKFTLDKAGALMSTINLGRFQCDQPDCTAFFTAFWKYIGHIEADHREKKASKVEPVDGLYRCEVDGCDRGYATRSNLLRHTMKKHQDLYKLQLMTQRKTQEREKLWTKKSQLGTLKNTNGKENMQDNKKPIPKGSDKKKSDEEKSNHWTKYGKPSLKSKEEASAMCNKKFPLQYPCMIKGCESVVSSERNILKHYIRHGLSERYLEEQRSHFIFCKKLPRSKYRDRSYRSEDSEESEETSFDLSENDDIETDLRGSETESSKPTSAREEPELSDAKQSTDESFGTTSVASIVVKRKRGRPRKINRDEPVAHRRRTERSRVTRSNTINHVGNGSESGTTCNTDPTQDKQQDQNNALNSFKPMGFEVSFLKFLEESTQSPQPPKRQSSDDISGEMALKRQHNIQLKNATVLCKRSDAYLQPRDSPNHICFRNPQKMKSLRNVKIVVDQTFSKVMDRLLKQLQEMQPVVILQK